MTATAPEPAPEVPGTTLYNGQATDQANIKATAWGGGSVTTVTDKGYTAGASSYKIVTRGLYQGGRLTLATPADLGNLTADKTRYLQLALAFDMPVSTAARLNAAPSGGQAHISLALGHGEGVFRLAQMPGGYQGGPPQGYQGGPPAGYSPNGAPGATGTVGPTVPEIDVVAPPIKSLHLTFTFADGSQSDIVRPLPSMDVGATWLLLGIPLAQVPVPASQATDAHLQSLTIAGDTPATLYVGQLRLVSDSLPITCYAGGEQDVARGDQIVFKGKAQGGAANIKYEWDFDTKGDFVPQAEGRQVTHVYAVGGSYKVTLRVSDVDGIKQAAMSSTVIHIED